MADPIAWNQNSDGSEVADYAPGVHLRIVQDAPDAWRALVRLVDRRLRTYRWIGPQACGSRDEAIAWSLATVDKEKEG